MDHVIINQWDAILMVVSIWPFRIVWDVFYLLTRSIMTISFVGGTVISFASHLALHLWMILHLGSSANWYCSDSAEHLRKNWIYHLEQCLVLMHGFYFTDGASSPGKVCAGGRVSGAPGKTFMIVGGWPMSWPERHVSGAGRMWQGTIYIGEPQHFQFSMDPCMASLESPREGLFCIHAGLFVPEPVYTVLLFCTCCLQCE